MKGSVTVHDVFCGSLEGNPLGDFVEHPRPQDGEVVVTKQYASAFFGTSLASTLAAARIDTLIICGLSTSGCVRPSALDALQHGFRPLVVADAVGEAPSTLHLVYPEVYLGAADAACHPGLHERRRTFEIPAWRAQAA